jgi:hypothetical protein
MEKKLRLAVLACLAAVVLVIPSAAQAGDTICIGTVLPGVHDNIVVPPNASCTIIGGVTVRGSIKALENSALDVRNIEIAGNVHGDKAEDFFVVNNVIGGNVEVKEGEAPSASLDVLIRMNRFQKGPFSLLPGQFTWGNIKVERMRGDIFVDQNAGVQNIQLQENIVMLVTNDELRVQTNSVDGNIQVFKTRGNGPKFVNGNVVRESVQCTENDVPFVGGPNVAAKAEGQCF